MVLCTKQTPGMIFITPYTRTLLKDFNVYRAQQALSRVKQTNTSGWAELDPASARLDHSSIDVRRSLWAKRALPARCLLWAIPSSVGAQPLCRFSI